VRSLGERTKEDPNHMSTFVHMELNTSDPKAAKQFYKAVFGWTYQDTPMPEGVYTMVSTAEGGIGGIAENPMPGAPSNWLAYVGVESVDQTVAKVEKAGGTVMMPATEIPGMGRFAVFTDPQGATFAAWEAAAPAGAEQATEVPREKKTSKKKPAKKKGAAKQEAAAIEPAAEEQPSKKKAGKKLAKKTGEAAKKAGKKTAKQSGEDGKKSAKKSAKEIGRVRKKSGKQTAKQGGRGGGKEEAHRRGLYGGGGSDVLGAGPARKGRWGHGPAPGRHGPGQTCPPARVTPDDGSPTGARPRPRGRLRDVQRFGAGHGFRGRGDLGGCRCADREDRGPGDGDGHVGGGR